MARTGDGSVAAAVVVAFVAGDAQAMTELLASDATFHSPVTDYRGRPRVGEVLSALVEVVTEVRVTRMVEGADGTAAFFTASAGGRRADGVLLVVGATSRPAAEVTLMVRPLGSLLSGIEQMKALLGRGDVA
jgi:SnoaL-like protein